MTNGIRWGLIVWFVIVSLLVIIPSCQLLWGHVDPGAAVVQSPQPATPPSPAATGKADPDAAGKPGRLDIYQAVVSQTLVQLMGTVVTALVAFAFVKGVATLANNSLLLKHQKEPEKMTLL